MLLCNILKGVVPDHYILPIAVVIVMVSAICISYLDTTEDEYNKCKSWKQQLMMFDLVFKLALSAYILSNKSSTLSPIDNALMLFIGTSSLALITFVMFGKETYTDWRRKFGYMFYYLTIGMTIADVILANKQRKTRGQYYSETSVSPKRSTSPKFSETSVSPKRSTSPKFSETSVSPKTPPVTSKISSVSNVSPQRKKMYSVTSEEA